MQWNVDNSDCLRCSINKIQLSDIIINVLCDFTVCIQGLPMSLSSTSTSLKSSGTFNSNSSISLTPSVDRYAALKDLDEQLREIKEREQLNTQTSPAAAPNALSTISAANPFKVPAAQQQKTPFQLNDQNGWLNSGVTTGTADAQAVFGSGYHNGGKTQYKAPCASTAKCMIYYNSIYFSI